MIKDFKTYEGIKWYSKGKLTEDPDFKSRKVDYGSDDNFITDDEFRQFLIDNGCYDEYMEMTLHRTREYIPRKRPNYLTGAFPWQSSPSKGDYWNDINIKWRNHIGIHEGIKWYSKGKLTEDPDYKDEISSYDDFIQDDEFRKFLIDNDCYDEYVEMFTNRRNNNLLPKHFSNLDRSNYINKAFGWADSPSGYGFWDNIDDKWINYRIKKNQNEGIKWYSKGKLTEDPNYKDQNTYDDTIKDEELRQFLIDNGCYEEYVSQMSQGFKQNYLLNRKRENRMNYINHAFNWRESPSGDQFWRDLSDKWKSKI